LRTPTRPRARIAISFTATAARWASGDPRIYGLEQFSDLGRKQIAFAFLVVQKVSEAPLGETEAIPRSDVEIAYAHFPCSFERALGVLVGMLVELVS
jgi:hypothetical protein